MRRISVLLAIVALAGAARAGEQERWLHVRVSEGGGHGESVAVNVPLTLAEQVLPAINSNELNGGKVRVHCLDLNSIDLRALLGAIRDTADGEFVTVTGPEENVRVAKQADHLVVQVREKQGQGHKKETGEQRVRVKIPMVVAEALLSGPKDQLDLVAAIRALKNYGDSELVAVEDDGQSVRVWVDKRSAGD